MKTHCFLKQLPFLLGLLLALVTCGVYAAEVTTLSGNKTEEFTYKAQNPLTPIYSLPLKYTYHGGAENGGVSVGSLNPIIPVSIGNWNMINQLSLNFIGTPGGVTGISQLPEPLSGNGSGVSGLGDTNFTSLFSPAHSGNYSWGVGPTIVLPTDTRFTSITDRTSRELGSGKFSAGPAAMFVTQPKPWTLGVSVKQVWSVLGNDTRHGVSQMVLQPFVNYNLSNGWYVVSDMNMIANWNKDNSQRWTVPIGGGVGKLFTIGKHAINTRLEGYYNPVRPDQAPDWSTNVTVQFLYGK
jgi:hypothetical protein